MKLYELVGCDKENGFSPFVWRIKMALAHKGLEAELVPLHFTEIKETLEFAGSKTVPVLKDGDNVVSDSWDIACYLEENYPDQPSLFNGDVGRRAAKLLSLQIAPSLLMPLFKTLAFDIHAVLLEKDKDYFRTAREPRIGCTLEQANEDFETSLTIFKNNLWPYNQYLKSADFFAGAEPAYSDYILYSTFLWARGTSVKKIIDDDDPLASWINRMDGLYGGLGGRVKYIG